jgi:hypothetical protein
MAGCALDTWTAQHAEENRLASWLPVRWTPPARCLWVRSRTATERQMQGLVSGGGLGARWAQSAIKTVPVESKAERSHKCDRPQRWAAACALDAAGWVTGKERDVPGLGLFVMSFGRPCLSQPA